MELRISTLKSQFEGKVSRLERELGEQMTARNVDAEALERLRRENHELQQRVRHPYSKIRVLEVNAFSALSTCKRRLTCNIITL